ncbi:MAG: hypothetical protein SOI13_01650 [Bifidobacterium mongoliense]|jgi:hypothetical protein|uniref:hypothetical protein n=1 Tax=Bifidobacterium mongoliense TaxID=518643 RepID=UPI002F35F3C5
MAILFAELHYGSHTIRFDGDATIEPNGLVISDEGVEGWYSSPDFKSEIVERAVGNGGHDMAPDGVYYASRVVTPHFYALGNVRRDVLDALDRVSRAVGTMVRFRVVDDRSDTFVVGMVRTDVGAGWHADWQSGSLTIECPRPERLSWSAATQQMFPVSRLMGGLDYGVEGNGLSYGSDGKGLSYGLSVGDERNLIVISNHGTALAYPTITVTGPFPNGVEIQTGEGGVIRYTGAIGMVPLVMQCDPRSMAASMGGVDVGRNLTGRDLPAIPAGGSMSLRLMSAGSGWVTVTTRDAYL